MEYRKNDIVTVSIEDIGNDGEGIGKTNGYTLFVKDAVLGDIVEARITKCKKNYGYARVEKVLKPSSFRVEPKCALHKRCGGCQIQAMDYAQQLAFKQNKVKNHLVRIGGFEEEKIDTVMEPIVGMEEPWHYRNKAQFPVGYDREGKLVTGFYAGRTHDIIANTDCALGAAENQKILEAILDYMKENRVTAYREKEGTGLVRHVLIRTGFCSGEIMVCLVINGRKLPAEERLTERLRNLSVEDRTQKRRIASISVSVNTERTNVIMGKEIRLLWGKERIIDTLGGIEFAISPLSFYQVNPRQTEKLYGLAVEYAGLTGRETVWDLYCGIGTISLFMAKKAKRVCGVEIIPQAIEDARENARRNGIANAEFYVGKAEEVLPEFYQQASAQQSEAEADKLHPDVIVVDPPRKGCDEKCLETMLAMRPERIVYVSCDSATLARDLKILCEGGYELKRVRAVDQFGQTVHVETVVLLSHKKPDGHINVKVEFGEGEGKVPLDNIAKRAEEYKPKERVTYKMIKEYIEAKYGFKVHTAYIAEVKRDLGLPMYDAPNAVEELKQPRKHPTAEKVEAIKDALKHFEVI